MSLCWDTDRELPTSPYIIREVGLQKVPIGLHKGLLVHYKKNESDPIRSLLIAWPPSLHSRWLVFQIDDITPFGLGSSFNWLNLLCPSRALFSGGESSCVPIYNLLRWYIFPLIFERGDMKHDLYVGWEYCLSDMFFWTRGDMKVWHTTTTDLWTRNEKHMFWENISLGPRSRKDCGGPGPHRDEIVFRSPVLCLSLPSRVRPICTLPCSNCFPCRTILPLSPPCSSSLLEINAPRPPYLYPPFLHPLESKIHHQVLPICIYLSWFARS